MSLLDFFFIAVSLLLVVSLLLTDRQRAKLSERNKLLCRENHKLRLKLKEYEDGTKG